MRFFKELVLGLRTYIDAHEFIRQHKMWGYVLLPGVINLVLFTVSIIIGWHYTDELTHWFFGVLGLAPDSGDTGWWREVLNIFLLVILRLATLMVYLMIYKYIVLIIMAPVLAFLSEKTEALATGRDYPFNLMQFLRDVMRGVLIAIRNITFELILTAILMLLVYIPIIGLIAPFFIFGVQSYYYGFSMIDYYSERHKRSIGESTRFVARHRGFAIANGALFYGLLVIPVIGILVAPTYAIVAATLGVLKLEEDGQG
jgi:CysZ protein